MKPRAPGALRLEMPLATGIAEVQKGAECSIICGDWTTDHGR